MIKPRNFGISQTFMNFFSLDMADSMSQDEGGDPNSALAETRQSKRAKSTLEPVQEGDIIEFSDKYDLKDESAWVCCIT